MKIAFNAGLATVASYYHDLSIKSAFSDSSGFLMAGWSLPYFTRMFTILLENAAEHSGIKHGDMSLDCVVELSGGTLSIRLSNQLGEDVQETSLSETIAKLNSEFGRDAASDFVQRKVGRVIPKFGKS